MTIQGRLTIRSQTYQPPDLTQKRCETCRHAVNISLLPGGRG